MTVRTSMCGRVSPSLQQRLPSEQRPCTLLSGHDGRFHVHIGPDGRVLARWVLARPFTVGRRP